MTLMGEQPGAVPRGKEIGGDAEALAEFIAESLEYIEAAEASLLALESHPDDPEPIHAVFRAFHTIKGTAPFLGLHRMARLAHLAEGLITRVREGEIPLRGDYADLALEACDALKALAGGLRDRTAAAPAPTPEGFDDLLARLSDPEAAGLAEGPAEAGAVPRVGDLLVAQGEATREQVEQAAQDQGDRPIGVALVRRGVVPASAVARALRWQRRAQSADDEDTVRVRVEQLDALADRVAELDDVWRRRAESPGDCGAGGARISALIAEMAEIAAAFKRMPARDLFRRLARPVRELARLAGKRVRLVCSGGDTPVNRSVAQRLQAPLVHLVRNAVAHGIECPEERQAAGKPPEGRVTLRACAAGNDVVIEVRDDGRGMDRRRILDEARARGLVAGGAPVSDEDLFGLLLQLGFSTSGAVSELAGRGVGMEVVGKCLQALGGSVHLDSVRGRGTAFTLRAPGPRRHDRARAASPASTALCEGDPGDQETAIAASG